MTATKQEPARDAKGRLICMECGGDGRIEVEGYGSSAALEPPMYLEECEACEGRGVRICPQCGEPATLLGEDGDHAYCGPQCAYDDENWPECFHLDGRPQDPAYAPWCSAECVEKFERRFAEVVREARHG